MFGIITNGDGLWLINVSNVFSFMFTLLPVHCYKNEISITFLLTILYPYIVLWCAVFIPLLQNTSFTATAFSPYICIVYIQHIGKFYHRLWKICEFSFKCEKSDFIHISCNSIPLPMQAYLA